MKIEDFIKGYWICNLGLRLKVIVEKKVLYIDIVKILMRVKKKIFLNWLFYIYYFFFVEIFLRELNV